MWTAAHLFYNLLLNTAETGNQKTNWQYGKNMFMYIYFYAIPYITFLREYTDLKGKNM